MFVSEDIHMVNECQLYHWEAAGSIPDDTMAIYQPCFHLVSTAQASVHW